MYFKLLQYNSAVKFTFLLLWYLSTFTSLFSKLNSNIMKHDTTTYLISWKQCCRKMLFRNKLTHYMSSIYILQVVKYVIMPWSEIHFWYETNHSEMKNGLSHVFRRIETIYIYHDKRNNIVTCLCFKLVLR